MTRNVTRRSFLRRALHGAGALPLLTAGACARGRGRPNFLVITLDTTRADRLSCYGYERPTTSNLDRLAAESIFHREAYSTSSWTLPAHASLFTGKFVSSHGARYHPEGEFVLSAALEEGQGLDVYRANAISPEETTLAQVLADAGYLTGAVVAGPWLKRVFRLDRGFDFYDDTGIAGVGGRPAPSVTYSALRWLKEVEDKPFFLFLNYFDAHAPYAIHEEFVRRYVPPSIPLDNERALSPAQSMLVRNAMYDSEIHFMDDSIGQLMAGMRDLGLYDATEVIVTADHGELLGEHGMTGHGKNLYQEVTRIPFFVKPPHGEGAPSESSRRVQILDIFPMVAARAELSAPENVQGVAHGTPARPVIAEVFPLETASSRGSCQCLWEGPHKFVLNGNGTHELYDLESDPREQKNLLTALPERARELETRLTNYLNSLPTAAPSTAPQQVDPETSEALRNLGYAG
ncbi:MAG: sulfatase [Candidatus Hydrogenedentes bacterium]|nr:sulfatase [Candidatus Hydrogenedentota bacterium]